MLTRRNWFIVAMCALVAAGPRSAQAQEVAARSFDQLRMIARLGDTMTITEASGRQVTGRLADLSPSSLELLVGSERRAIGEADVRVIKAHGHANLATGAKWGLGIGAGFGVLAVMSLCGQSSECGEYIPLFGAMYGGLGAAMGVGFAAATPTRAVIYVAPGATTPKVGISPFVTRDRQGAAVSIAFGHAR